MRKALLVLSAVSISACTDTHPANTEVSGHTSSPSRVAHVLYFDTDSHHVRVSEREKLILFLESWQDWQLDKISIEGHADRRASDTYNLELSERRVLSTRRIVSEVLTREPDVQMTPFGERAPADAMNSQLAWQANRRVTLELWLASNEEQACSYLRPSRDSANQELENLGCATTQNRLNSLAYPVPNGPLQKLGPPDPTATANSIQRYRTTPDEFGTTGTDE